MSSGWGGAAGILGSAAVAAASAGGRGAPFLLSLGFLAWKVGTAKQSRSSHCPFHPRVYLLISCLPRKHCVDTERTSRFLQGLGFLETDGLYNKEGPEKSPWAAEISLEMR